MVELASASVNFSEPGAADLCAHFLSRDVGIEVGLWTARDTQLLLTLGFADRCLRILIKLQEPEIGPTLATAEVILHCLGQGHVGLPTLLHGDHKAIVWPILDAALQRGYDTCIGLEDMLTLQDGSQPKTTRNSSLSLSPKRGNLAPDRIGVSLP